MGYCSMKVPRKIRQYFHQYCSSLFPRTAITSKIPLTVLMPLAEKDLGNAEYSVPALRQHLLHPIEEFVIVGQNSDQIRNFCFQNKITYYNENEILPAEISNRDLRINGINSTGWIKQQFIKLGAFNFINAKNIYAHDADTFLLRNLSFFKGDKQILLNSDEYIDAYHKMNRYLLGNIKRYPRSFIAHGMLFQKEYMNKLHAHVLNNTGLTLFEAVLKKLQSKSDYSLAEYELYGNFLYNFYPDSFVSNYWYNFQIRHDQKFDFEVLSQRYKRFNSISYHVRPFHKKKNNLFRQVRRKLFQ